jgi:hypothetical protein
LRQPLTRKLSLTLAFNLFALTVITITRRTPARPMDSMGPDIFTAAFSWAWVHGPAGATDTAGANIVSVTAAAEAIAAAAGPWPTAAVLRVVAVENIGMGAVLLFGLAAGAKCTAAQQPPMLE